MRITIEIDERGRGEEPSVQTTAAPGRLEAIDAGPPPAALVQLSTVEAPRTAMAAEGGQVTNAGPPDASFLQALEASTPASSQAAGGDRDAGAAPDGLT